MKTTVIPEETKKELPFPKLMIAEDGEIVLFSEEKVGVIVNTKINSFYQIGEYSDDWHMNSFKDFYGSITMSNL